VSDVRWLSAEEQRAWRAYRRMRTRLDLQLARDLARDSHLSESDYDVLSTLTEQPGRTWRASELAGQLLWSTSRLAHHLGRMQRRGLIARGDCAEDGRGATVTLTDAGRAALAAAAPEHVASVRRHFIDLLTPSEVAALTAVADKVLEHLAEPEPPRP
jgi:DNA-binding MarR family transcriptional regulator